MAAVRASQAPQGSSKRACDLAAALREIVIVSTGLLLLFAHASRAWAEQLPPLSAGAEQLQMAARYENGESVAKNYQLALQLYCGAARRGDPSAFYHIGWMYLNGRGVPRDDRTAVMWLRKAAAHGMAQAASLLNLLSQVPPSADRGCPSPLRGLGSAPLTPPPPEIRDLIDVTAQDFGLSPRLLQSIISVESGYNPHAVSLRMAAGLMQLMPETALRFGVRNRFDPRDNMQGGATYLRLLLRMFGGDLTLALAAYNAGEQAVISHGGVPPYQETIGYVAAVKRLCACDGMLDLRGLK